MIRGPERRVSSMEKATKPRPPGTISHLQFLIRSIFSIRCCKTVDRGRGAGGGSGQLGELAGEGGSGEIRVA